MAERVAEGVEVLRLRPPSRVQKLINIYLLEGDGGVVVYETGTAGMAGAIREAAAERGGIERIVLSHAHADHRGGASRLDAPILCHPDERPGAEGDGWKGTYDMSKVGNPLIRAMTPRAVNDMDGGPVEIADTLSEGDRVAGFEVIHLPGHTPGQIGLWRESDRLAIVSDAVFVFTPFSLTARPGRVRLPPAAVRPDDAAARSSIRKVASLEPSAVWLGHYGPITDDIPARLAEAADGD